MGKTSKIAISISSDVLDEVEKERKLSGESRSELFRRAVELLLKRRNEQKVSEQYIRAYEHMPENKTEIETVRSAARNILAGEPW